MKEKFLPAILGIALGASALAAQYMFTASSDRTPSTEAMSATALAIEQLEKSIDDQPSLDLYIRLGNTYLQHIRETGDSTLYANVKAVAAKAQEIDSTSKDALVLLAAVEAGTHNFQRAYEYIEEAIAQNPDGSLQYGLKGDSEIELGRYEDALISYQTMIDMRPDFNSFTRIAYARELYGDILGAEEALKRALEAGSTYPENLAWVETELGRLALRSDLSQARSHFEKAEAILPQYAPAQAGLSHVAFFEGDVEKAKAYAEKAINLLPTAEYTTLLGDIYYLSGEENSANQQYTLAELAIEQSEAQGINVDLEYAQFLLERERDPHDARVRAERAVLVRPNAVALDTLAWSLYRQGDFEEALVRITEALDIGGGVGRHSARILYHAGMIALQHGDRNQARIYLEKALALHPHFSLRESDALTKTLQNL